LSIVQISVSQPGTAKLSLGFRGNLRNLAFYLIVPLLYIVHPSPARHFVWCSGLAGDDTRITKYQYCHCR